MAIHLGEAIENVRESKGMPKTTLASRMGRSAKNLHELLKNPSWDTQLLRKVSEVLEYNFFMLLSQEVEKKLGPSSSVSEPAATYQTKTPGGVGLTIHVDPNDPESTRKLLKALKALGE